MRILVALEPADFRKGIDGLARLCTEQLKRDPFCGWVFVFRKRRATAVKVLVYDGQGFWLCHKRLSSGRFRILPWVEVRHLASHLLGRMARVLARDWEQVYGHPIHFLETFVDPQQYRGTCYRAANWIVLGRTTGRGKDDQTHKPNRPIKDVLGYPLCRRFRHVLSQVS